MMSSSLGSTPAPIVNNGTGSVKLNPYSEAENYSYDGTTRAVFETISAQNECVNFSHEELRVVDYQNGTGWPRNSADDQSAKPFGIGPPKGGDKRRVRSHLDLLRGVAMEVQVGPAADAEDPETKADNTWYLPVRLISKYSDFLRAACEWRLRENLEKKIELQDEDPDTFALFVEWMYYGTYDPPAVSLFKSDEKGKVGMNVLCWTLADKFLCTDFKNLAMSRLHAQHVTAFFPLPVATQDVRYAYDNSSEGSELRKFYLDFVISNFANSARLQGTLEEWDEVLQDYSELRFPLLQLIANKLPRQVLDVKSYYAKSENLSKAFGKLAVKEDSAVPSSPGKKSSTPGASTT